MTVSKTIIYNDTEYEIKTNYPFENNIKVNGEFCMNIKKSGKNNMYYAVLPNNEHIAVIVCKKDIRLIDICDGYDVDKAIVEDARVRFGFFEKIILAMLLIIPASVMEVLATKLELPYTKLAILFALFLLPYFVGTYVSKNYCVKKSTKKFVLYLVSVISTLISSIVGIAFLGMA